MTTALAVRTSRLIVTTPDGAGLLGGDMVLVSDRTADERRGGAWRAAITRLELVDDTRPEVRERYHRFIYFGIAGWMMSRASGVAVVLADPEGPGVCWRRYDEVVERHRRFIGYEIRDNEQRDRMTLSVCYMVAGTMIDTAYMIEDRRHTRLQSSYGHRNAALGDSFPGYTMIRNWLAHELGARYWDACAVALNCTARHAALESSAARQLGHYFDAERERGWL